MRQYRRAGNTRVDSAFDAAADEDGDADDGGDTDDGHVVDERTSVIDLDLDDEPGSGASSPVAAKCLAALLAAHFNFRYGMVGAALRTVPLFSSVLHSSIWPPITPGVCCSVCKPEAFGGPPFTDACEPALGRFKPTDDGIAMLQAYVRKTSISLRSLPF